MDAMILCSRSRSSTSRTTLRFAPARSTWPSSVALAHRRPQAEAVELETIELGLLPAPARHDRPALMVHLQHQLRRVGPGVIEQFLEYPSDIGHEVDGVVPHDHQPRPFLVEFVLLLDLFDLGGRNCSAHREIVARSRAGSVD